MIKTLKTKMINAGYQTETLLATKIALLLVQVGESVRAMLLDGPPGAGKTYLAKCVAKVLGVDYIYLPCHPGTQPEDILYDINIVNVLRAQSGDEKAVESSADIVELGFLPAIFRASQKGPVVAFVDEIDKASPKVDSLFLTALQEGEVLVKGLGKISANTGNLLVFFTKNDERQLSEPLMRRCRREYLGFPSRNLEMAILTGQVKSGQVEPIDLPRAQEKEVPELVANVLVKVANMLRDRQEDIIKAPATQELMYAGQDIMRLAEWDALEFAGEIAFGWLAAYQEDREVLSKIITPQQLQSHLAQAIETEVNKNNKNKNTRKIDDEFVDFAG